MKDRITKRQIIIIISVLVVTVVAVIAVSRMLNGQNEGIDNKPEQDVKGESNVLVAYFSWSGNVQQIARWVAEETDGEIFRIVPQESYGKDYANCANRSKKELNDRTRPKLSSHIDKDIMAKYDTIYLGFPVWWYELPMPVWTFLEEYDLEGKTIIPSFSDGGTPDGGNTLERLKELAPKSNVLSDDALEIRKGTAFNSEKKIRDWAKSFK